MRVACIGTGFVGVVTAAVLAKLGNKVTGLDIDEAKIAKLKEGEVPFFEPGLSDLLIETQKSGNLTFTTSYSEAISDADIVMVMVGTPARDDGQADLKYVEAAVVSAAPHLRDGAIVVIKSTVPPGTNSEIAKLISKHTQVKITLASVPEFLREGTAVEDTLRPDRVIIGASDAGTIAKLRELHAPLTQNIIVMSAESAQMAKYASNVYLALRITFANQMADLCEKNGADIDEVIKGISADRRIGSHYWYPGLGYGGSCFPKDVKEIAAYAKSVGESESIFIAVDEQNEKRIPRMMAKYSDKIGGFAGKRVAILGLSFKKNTNDTRVAPALKVIPYLLNAGADIIATDPQAINEAQKVLPNGIKYVGSASEALKGATVAILLVEWDEYLRLQPVEISSLMAENKVFIDTRNQFDESEMEQAGLKYLGVGK